MTDYRAQTELAQRIEGIAGSLECGDGGVRDDFYAALAEVDSLATADIRSIGVEIVDAIHGYTCEWAPSPEAHAGMYDVVERVLRARLGGQ